MRRLLLTLCLLLPVAATAQDTAATIVDRCLQMLNYEALPHDSTLVLETTVTFHGATDTFTMRRYFAQPNMMRIEVRRGDQLTAAYCTNGTTRHRKYFPARDWWNDIDSNQLAREMSNYDFHMPLYRWRQKGIQLQYRGTIEAKGQPLQVVRADHGGSFVRYYMFDASTGLLTIMTEKDERSAEARSRHPQTGTPPIEYKFYHEYLPVGASLIASEESFMRERLLTVMRTTAHFEPRNNLLFNQD